jgi:D-glycerate 3-kinase
MRRSNIWPVESAALSGDKKSPLIDLLAPIFSAYLHKQSIEMTDFIRQDFEQVYLPMACWLASKHSNETLVVGLNGAQGSGKSTLALILADILQAGLGKKVLCLSIDDLYLTADQRQHLAKNIHPLLLTRGVPGTHDLNIATSILTKFKKPVKYPLRIPLFDKSVDDRVAESEWLSIDTKPDIIIFEGWCVGAQAESEETLIVPVNALERNEDADCLWRRYVNEQLKNDYKRLFSSLDILIMLKIPDFSKVLQWRLLQETKLSKSLTDSGNRLRKTMNETELKRFIMHFERLTRNTLKYLPDISDVVIELGHNRQVMDVRVKY